MSRQEEAEQEEEAEERGKRSSSGGKGRSKGGRGKGRRRKRSIRKVLARFLNQLHAWLINQYDTPLVEFHNLLILCVDRCFTFHPKTEFFFQNRAPYNTFSFHQDVSFFLINTLTRREEEKAIGEEDEN